MSYCTQADLVGRFGEAELIQLTTGDQDPGAVIDSAVVALAIQDADAEIDGYLARRYTLPLTESAANLTRIACDIARYRLYENEPTKTVIDRYKLALEYLRDVASGKVNVGPGPGPGPIDIGFGEAVMTASTPVFSREAL